MHLFFPRCSKNCVRSGKISRSKKVSLSTKCIAKECSTISNYKWILFKETRSHLNGTMWHKTKVIKPYTEGFTDVDSLILTNLQKLGANSRDFRIKIRSVITLTVKNAQIEEEDEMVLTLNAPPYSLSNPKCRIFPEVGKAKSTVFNINCGKWFDEDKRLFFEYRYKRSNNIVIISSGWSSNVTARLPLGVERENFSIPIEVRVHDFSGDFTKVTLLAKVKSKTF